MKTIFDEFSNAAVKNLSERPEALNDASFLRKTAASSPQLGVNDILNPACGRTPINLNLAPQIVAALNLALTADTLETEFYSRGLNTPGLIPNELRLLFARILLNEVGHRETLITILGSNAFPKPTFDFTVGGQIPDVFSNFSRFVALGHTFEDNGVRALKGQAPNVMSDDSVLTLALRFHSVEARHASELRRLNGEKAWIVLNQRAPNLPALVQGVYNGEENTVQFGINLVAATGFPATTVSEAFDEPITGEQAMQNLAPFISSLNR
jgi:rubrerythrin